MMNIQMVNLRRIAKLQGFSKCPQCGQYGDIWQAYDPEDIGWIKYCYKCSYMEGVTERRMERIERSRKISRNEARIADLERELRRLR